MTIDPVVLLKGLTRMLGYAEGYADEELATANLWIIHQLMAARLPVPPELVLEVEPFTGKHPDGCLCQACMESGPSIRKEILQGKAVGALPARHLRHICGKCVEAVWEDAIAQHERLR